MLKAKHFVKKEPFETRIIWQKWKVSAHEWGVVFLWSSVVRRIKRFFAGMYLVSKKNTRRSRLLSQTQYFSKWLASWLSFFHVKILSKLVLITFERRFVGLHSWSSFFESCGWQAWFAQSARASSSGVYANAKKSARRWGRRHVWCCIWCSIDLRAMRNVLCPIQEPP